MHRYILDASAILALINREKGFEEVEEILPYSVMSAVNIAECAAILNLIQIPEKEVFSLLKDLIPEIITFDVEQAFVVGFLRKETRTKGLSLGDRACLALGKVMKLPVVTADKVWKDLDCGVKVKCIR